SPVTVAGESSHGLLRFPGDLVPEHVGLEADGQVEAVGVRSGLGPAAHLCEKSGSGETGNRITQEGSSVHEVGRWQGGRGTSTRFPMGDARLRGELLLGKDGNFYGTASSGGSYNQGTLFQI